MNIHIKMPRLGLDPLPISYHYCYTNSELDSCLETLNGHMDQMETIIAIIAPQTGRVVLKYPPAMEVSHDQQA